MKPPIIEAKQLSVAFSGRTAVSNINMSIAAGEIHALIGCNGAGKSVFAKALAGIIRPGGGSIYLNGSPVAFSDADDAARRGIAYSPQELSVFPEFSIADNLFINAASFKQHRVINPIKTRRLTRDILDKLHINASPGQKISTLSRAQQFLLQFMRCIIANPSFIILDELSAAMTAKEMITIRGLLEECRQKNIAILYISHHIDEILSATDRITIMRDGESVSELEADSADKNLLTQLMLGKNRQEYYPKLPVKPGRTLLEISHITNQVLHNISFQLHEGEIIGIAGIAGSGRTQLLNAIAGLEPVSDGDIIYPAISSDKARSLHRIIGYIPENRDKYSLFRDLSTTQNITIRDLSKVSRHSILDLDKETVAANLLMHRLDVRGTTRSKSINTLSSGNKQKVVVSQCLHSGCHIYLFDEPTQGIDIAGKVELYNIMNEFVKNGAGILIASSDFSELTGMCDRIMILKQGSIIAELNMKDTSQLNLLEYFI